MLDDTMYGGITKVANHSCDPNLAYVVQRLRHCAIKVVIFKGIRPLSAGAELLEDYGWS